jgi:hypothetical protein
MTQRVVTAADGNVSFGDPLSEIGHHHPRLGSTSIAHAFQQTEPVSDGDPNRTEADMRHITTTISGHHSAHDVQAALFWIFAGIIVVIAFGDVLTLLAVAFAIVTTAWWTSRKFEHRVARNDAKMASVTHLRPVLIEQRELKSTTAHASWRGPSAA